VADLVLKSLDLQIPQNNKKHHTEEMGRRRLILRRGQKFGIQLFFNRPFQPQKDHITFVTETGELALPLGSTGSLKMGRL
jgi:transglutaminase 7